MYLGQFNKHANAAMRARQQMARTGTTFAGAPLWTTSEDEVCRRHYPDYAALQKALPNRSFNAIKSRCRTLGIVRTIRAYTGRDLKILRAGYATTDLTTLLEQFPGRTPAALKRQATELGLKRPRLPYAPSGDYLLDALRQRCREERYCMADLDEYVKQDRYFRHRHWRGPRGSISYTHIIRAIHELGGRLRIEWSDQS